MVTTSDQRAELEQFAASRPHWKFYDRDQSKYYAGRHFDYGGGVGNRFLLSVAPQTPRRRFSAQINTTFAAGPEFTEFTDSIETITTWVNGWEKTLEVPLTLAECRSNGAAHQIVKQLNRTQLGNLAYLLDLSGGPENIRYRLVEKFWPRSAG